MGTFVPLPNGVQAEMVAQLDTEIVTNRLWFTFDNPPYDQAAIDGLAAGLAAWWADMLLPYQSADLTALYVVARDWSTIPPILSSSSLMGIAGGDARESSTANVAVVVPFKYPLGVKLKRNKHYVPGIPEAEITLNTTSDAIRDALFEAYASLVDLTRLFSPVLNWRWVLTSAWEANAPRPAQLAYDSQGIYPVRAFVLGQRRKRLPPG